MDLPKCEMGKAGLFGAVVNLGCRYSGFIGSGLAMENIIK